ncbi:DUF4856 domain-containing protein [Chitinophaga niabensis]|uniref:DUF4856 domain-containing protein n=1 Tax=Chitinophaga niabensis TaxID=536979 RepID=A0A1N6D6H0_9BACT|nr:DUF4856 domain-containing protein [Chitinophaga niabensis]SIN66359.1 protein of unknown function [Chitinophaga niabensis]
MRNKLYAVVLLLGAAATVSSCKDDDAGTPVRPYTVPTTYSFANANYTKSTQRVKMLLELDTYLKTANTGLTTVPLDQAKVNNMWANTNNPFADASLNTSGVNIKDFTTDATLYKLFADSVLIYNTGTPAVAGTGGFLPRNTGKIIVGPRGMEYGQTFLKGTFSGFLFKKAVDALTAAKAKSATDTAAAQLLWDEAFGYLAVPVNYDSSLAYANTDPNRPLHWGGYLRERGRGIQAGGIIFGAFLKGRAAIGGYDVNVRNAQADIILAKWEQLAAAAALEYVTAPTASSAVGNPATQFHALSEGFGFIKTFKYRPSNSKLSAANFAILEGIMNKDFYALVNQAGFTDLKQAQNIIKTTYGL